MPSPLRSVVPEALVTCSRRVMCSVAAIYSPRDERRADQVGTGMFVSHYGRRFLVTARHVLLGHDGLETAADKAVFLSGFLKQIGDFARPDVGHSPLFDLAAVELTELAGDVCMPSSCFLPNSTRPASITICGYLARDFRRSLKSGLLAPRPYVYTNLSAAVPAGYVGMRYPKRRNRDSKTGKLVMAPIPRGLSGGPMLDTIALARDQVRIVGVFTDKPPGKSIAYGEVSPKVLAMLDLMIEQTPDAA